MSQFPVHRPESAPEGSRVLLEQAGRRYGFVPNLLGVLAEAPAALQAYDALGSALGESSLSPLEQQVVLVAASVDNGCEYCVAAHSAVARGLGASGEVLEALRTEAPLAEPRLEALRDFTRSVVANRGWVPRAEQDAFFAAGFSRSQVLEVIVGVAFKTLSNYTNHVVETPLDSQFEAFRWTRPEPAGAL